MTFFIPYFTVVTVSAHDSREFKGLHLTVHRAPTSNNTEEFLGEFIKYPDDKLKLLSCLGGTQVMFIYNRVVVCLFVVFFIAVIFIIIIIIGFLKFIYLFIAETSDPQKQ